VYKETSVDLLKEVGPSFIH